MLNKLAFAATAAVAMLGLSSSSAHAETYVNSPANSAGGACGLVAVQAQVGLEDTGYWTGDRHYVRVAAQSGCGSNVAILWLSLPPGATPTPTTADPVRCTRGRGSTVLAWNGECNMNPGYNATMGRWYLGWSQLTMDASGGTNGDWVEIRVPVTYNRRLNIADGAARVSALVQNNFADLTPILGLSVTYRPQFTNIVATNYGQGYGSQWGSWDGERFDLSLVLHNYFEGGALSIEYGTFGSFNLSTGTIAVTNANVSQPSVTFQVSNLAQNTTYNWRAKFVNNGFTYYGPVQTFTTYAYLSFPQPDAPRLCSRFSC